MSTLQILSKEEEKKFESPPKFDSFAKNYFFKLNNEVLEIITEMKSDSNKILFILMFGYFKISNRFFEINEDDENFMFITNRNNFDSFNFNEVSTRTVQRYKQIIKLHFQIVEFTNNIEVKLQHHAIELANNFTHRKKIFYSLVDYSKKLNIEVPSYTILSKIISTALNFQTKNVLDGLKQYKNDERLKVLDDFTDKNESYKNRYNVGIYKKLGHSTNKKQMVASFVQLETIKSKFTILKPIIDEVGINDKISQYYSKWLEQSKITQLTQKDIFNSRFMLLSFVKYQYNIRSDNLIDRFISIVQSAKNSLFRHQKELTFKHEPLKKALMQSLEDSNLSIINDVNKILENDTISDSNKVSQLKEILASKTQNLKTLMTQKSDIEQQDLNRFDFIEQASKSLQGKLSNVVKLIEFDKKSSNKNLIMALNYFKNTTNFKQNAPIDFLDEDEKLAVYDSEGKIKVSLYKALLFIHISDGIKSGILNLKYSYKYKSFEEYMIAKDEYQSKKQELLKHYELNHLADLEKFITPINTKLEASFKSTNEKIINELNFHIKLTTDSFILTTPKLDKTDEQIEHTISKYFPQAEFISVIDLLHSIQLHTGFLDSFKHYSLQNTKIKKLDENLLYASIVGYGCNISLSKMSKISKGISENELDTVTTWYLSETNIVEANDKVVAFTDNLEISKLLRDNQNINHTSSDGQKFNIKSSIDSTNAGYSFKYFGTAKGVSVYTFIDESHKLFYSTVINVNERESGYVIDGLMHNDVVKSDIHSTDTHGFSEVIFAISHLLGFSFAPRIKNFKDQQLYGTDTPKAYHTKGYKLLPKRKINFKIIKENWDDILRFVLTIKTRKTTASQLLKRLTSYSKHHKLYAAIKEFGKIIKTDFLLTYIDDVELRQRIEKQLNKVEASNRFSKAVFFGNNAEFIFASQEEQNIANNCKRLIQNAVVLWNYLYLNKKLQQASSQMQKDEIIEALKNSSIIHWSHINFYGTYDFTKVDKKVLLMIN
ncbi:MAG: Tn3 family transposase [Campylobacterota bacterium]|nr:Tn3 family transposase [Campylobacterota bacterium]